MTIFTFLKFHKIFFSSQNKKEFSKNILKWRKNITAVAWVRIFFFNSLNFFLFPFEFQYLVSGRGDLHTWRYQKRLRKICLNFSDFFFSFASAKRKYYTKKYLKLKYFRHFFPFYFFFHTNYRRIYTFEVQH